MLVYRSASSGSRHGLDAIAPAGIEMAQAMKARVLGASVRIDDAGCVLHRVPRIPDDRRKDYWPTATIGEHEIEFTPGTCQSPLAKRIRRHRQQRSGWRAPRRQLPGSRATA